MYRIAPDVVQAIARDDFKVWAYCDDGTIREIDMKPFIAKAYPHTSTIASSMGFPRRGTCAVLLKPRLTTSRPW